MNTRLLTILCGSLALGLAACAPRTTQAAAPSPAPSTPAPAPVTATPAPAASSVNVTVVGVNDFHGNLVPTGFSGVKIPDPKDATKTISLPTGGVEVIGGYLADARKQNPNTLFVGVGDLIGASPLISSLLRDEPTIEAMNQLGMKLSTVGNHEFDQGYQELKRIQSGGCASNDTAKACKFNPDYKGATFPYLAANVIEKATGKTLFPPYSVQTIGGAKIAFVGTVLQATPTIVTPSGVAGLEFGDEADAINKVVPELKAQGVDAIIALMHQGGTIDTTQEKFDTIDCKTLKGPIVDLVKRLDPAVNVVMSAHTHVGYNCDVNGRTVIQGDAYGHLLQRLDLKLDTNAHKVLEAKAQNVVMDTRSIAKDAAMTALVTKAKGLTDPIANQEVARLAVGQISRTNNDAGESALGDVIADSQLAATSAPEKGGAVVAFMNPGGIRADLPGTPRENNAVTFGDVFTVQPFGNSLTVMTLTGAQIKTLLEQQFDNAGVVGQTRILQVSNGFSYKFDTTLASGQRVNDVTLKGAPLDPAANYRVTVNSFLADGGDGFTVLREGQNRLGGDLDVDAFQAYLKANAASLDGKVQGRLTKVK